jgi:hypothetical protein
MNIENNIENEPNVSIEEWEEIKKYMTADGMNPKTFEEIDKIERKEEQSFRKCQRMLMNLSKNLKDKFDN